MSKDEGLITISLAVFKKSQNFGFFIFILFLRKHLRKNRKQT